MPARRVAAGVDRASRALARGDGLLALVLGAFGAVIATQVGRMMSSDGWLALVAGRSISQEGLPARNRLTVLGNGAEWVDQQWLGQVILYDVERVGGVAAVVALNLVLVVGAYGSALAAARALGADAAPVAIVGAVGLLPFVATASSVRPQSFTYVMFAGLVVLLLPRGRLPAHRVVGVVALLVLWANLHGSVLLAAGIVCLRGVAELKDRGVHRQALLLVGLPFVAVFASPYAAGLPGYYRATAFNPTFARYLAQWGPTQLAVVSLPTFVLVLGIVWLLGRASFAYSTFERILLAVAVLEGLLAVRDWPWLVLIAILLVPKGIDAARSRAPRRPPVARLDLAVAAAGLALLVVPLAAAFAGLDRAQRSEYPPAAAVRVAQAARTWPDGRILASVRFADWLLWRRPELAGRVEFDARYELLSAAEIERNALFRVGAGTTRALGRDAIFVLDPQTDRRAIGAITPRVRRVFGSSRVFVGVRNAR